MPNTESPSTQRHTKILAVLAALASASALWAVFLWRELLAARAGETPFCGFGESADCGTLWSAAFASTLHDMTGVPVAGWGLVWALVAALLPLAGLYYHGRPALGDALATAIELTAAAGALGIVILLAASAAEGMFCTSCALTYVLTLAYAAVTFLALRRPSPRSSRGLAMAAGATVVAYLLLLYPGLETPKSAEDEGRQALANAPRATATEPAGDGAASGGSGDGAASTRPARDREARIVGGVDVDNMLEEFIATLTPRTYQGLSDTLYIYRNGRHFSPEEPRALTYGEPDARVKVTDFSDVLCSHCATLHQTMSQLARLLPAGSFSLDARHFPLDGRCNPHMSPRDGDNVRCLGAKAQICVEDTGRGTQFATALYGRQRGLTSEQVYELAAPFIERDELIACLRSAETERKLADDVAFGWRYEPHGTPLVLVNGRQGTPFPPFLYAIILAGGDPDHPAFAVLPPPNPPPPHDHEH